jgi:hypothetical protein
MNSHRSHRRHRGKEEKRLSGKPLFSFCSVAAVAAVAQSLHTVENRHSAGVNIDFGPHKSIFTTNLQPVNN